MKVLRTPDFTVDGYPWEPRYADTSDGLRMAYVDEGTGPVVLMLHGEPTWGFLYRKMIPVFLDAGFRVVVPDLIGFGRSDKPTEVEDYTYARHVEWVRSVLFDRLDLQDVTLVGQDWGGLIGLRVAMESPGRFARIVAANTGLPDGLHRLPEEWWRFRDFVMRTPDLPIGFLVAAACAVPMDEGTQASYEAPFPDATYKAGAKAFPDLIPQTPDDPATPDNQRAWEYLTMWAKPFLCAYSDGDPITRGGDKPFLERVPGTIGQPHAVIEGAAHFLQEDKGPELAQVIVDWLRATSS